MEVLELNQNDIQALLSLIEFHDDWDEVSEMLGTDIAKLYDKVAALRTYWWCLRQWHSPGTVLPSLVWLVWLAPQSSWLQYSVPITIHPWENESQTWNVECSWTTHEWHWMYHRRILLGYLGWWIRWRTEWIDKNSVWFCLFQLSF